MSKTAKRIIAVAVAIALILGTFAGVNFVKKRKETKGVGNKTEENIYYEVKFSTVSDQGGAETEKITLPETVMVKSGTIVGALETPAKEGGVFTGWYYDAERAQMALSNDPIEEDTTLYADFSNSVNSEGRFKINYMSSQDVEDTFKIDIVSYGYSLDEVRNMLKVTDISEGGEAVEFELTEVKTYLVSEDHDSLTYADYANMYELSEGDSPERYQSEVMGMDADAVNAFTTSMRANENTPVITGRYQVTPVTSWQKGDLFQVEILSTEHVRFERDNVVSGKDVTYYNFTVARKEVNTLKVNKDVYFIDVHDTEGVDVKGGLYNLVAGLNDDTVEKQETKGIMKYAGDIAPGTTIAVYDGVLHGDFSVDGEVLYLRVTDKNADGSYNYEGAEFEDVLFVPNVIPIPDDGSFSDGKNTVAMELLSFGDEKYRMYNLDETTTLEAGDFVAFYTGALDKLSDDSLVGFGLVSQVTESGNKATIYYSEVTKEDIISSFQMYTAESNVEVPLTEEQIVKLEEEFARQAEENNFAQQAIDYVENLIYNDELDKEEYAAAVRNLTFEDLTGKNYTLEEIRLLADDDDGWYEIPGAPVIKGVVSPKLDHFEGKTGIRAEVSATFDIKIKLNSTAKGQNELELKVVAAFEQEVTLGVSISADADWDWIVIIPVLRSVDVKVSFTAGTYTGIGASIAVTTSVDDDESEWKKLVEANNKVNKESGDKKDSKSLKNTLSSLKDTFKTISNGVGGSKEKDKKVEEVKDKKEDQFESNGGIGGDLPDKYSGMLSNDAEYIDIVNVALPFDLAISPDPLHLVEFSLGINFVVGIKVNCMMGWGISYANAKEYCFKIHINVFGDKDSSCTSSQADLETPNFRADFYVFGNIGARVGVRFDARVGIISTKLNSVGIVAEAGLYWEIYGFLYVYYSWESGEGSDMGAMGSMLFEIGVYLKIDFCARLIGPGLNKSIKIYEHQWPLLDLGATEVPIEFDDVDKSHLDLEFPTVNPTATPTDGSSTDGNVNVNVALSNTLKIPQDVYKVKLMSLKDGKVSSKDMDSSEVGDEAYKFTQNGVEYTQYNEKSYNIRCVDLDKKGGKATDTHQIRYLPATNEIYVKPAEGVDELYGQVIITYKDNTFGFNTNSITRTVNVHWKGVAATAEVQYYVKNENGEYDLFQVGDFNGFDGIQYDLVVNKDLCEKIPGYTLTNVGFDDEDKLWDTYQRYADTFAETSKKFNEQHKLGYTGEVTVTRSIYDKARADSITARKALEEFQSRRKEVMAKGEGTLFFLMCSKNTVVRLYYSPVKGEAEWIINPRLALTDADGRNWFSDDCESRVTIQKDEKIKNYLPDYIKAYLDEHSDHNFNWYYYQYSAEADGAYHDAGTVLYNKEKWLEFAEDTIMPARDVVIIGIEDNWREKTVTWYDGEGEVFDTEVYRYELDRIGAHDAPPAETLEGREFLGWKYADDTIFKDGTLMPKEDISLYPYTIGREYTVHYTLERLNRTTNSEVKIKYGDSIYDALFDDSVSFEGRVFKLYLETDSENPDEKEMLINESLSMPAMDINVTGRYELADYVLTWENGAEKTTEIHKFGDTILLPTGTTESGLALGWLLDGKVVKGSFKMPAHDVSITANPHNHDWMLVNSVGATCVNTGLDSYECVLCNSTKGEIVAINPDNHASAATRTENYREASCEEDGYTGDVYCAECNKLLETGTVLYATGHSLYFDEVVIERANCIHGNILRYRCDCGYTQNDDDGVINPDNHRTEIRNERAATCKEEGYSGDTYCLDCGVCVETGHAIDKTAHTYGEFVTVKPATISEDGRAERECSVCHYVDAKVLPKSEAKYTVIYASSRDANGDEVYDPAMAVKEERVYEVGKAYTLESDLFPVENMYIANWRFGQGLDSIEYTADAAIVWDVQGATPSAELYNKIYLPELDTDGDLVITIKARFITKEYYVEFYKNATEELIDGYRSYVGSGIEADDWDYLQLQMQEDGYIYTYASQIGKLLGWSLTPNGEMITEFPSVDTIGNGNTLKLYAVWGVE